MTELLSIFLQFIIFIIIFSFPINPNNFNKLIKSSVAVNYIDCQAINIIIIANILLINSFFDIKLNYIFLGLLFLSIIFLLIRNKEYILIINKKNLVKFLYFFIITISIFITTAYTTRLEWDGFHWIQKALVFFNNTEIQNLKYTDMPEYPHLGGYIWAFFWKNSFLELEYFGRFFYIYFYIVSIFAIFNVVKIESNKIIYFLILSLVLITFERYLFGGYQEYLIFSTLVIASRFIAVLDFKNIIDHRKILLILFILSTLIWFKDEGIFYFLIFGSLLIIMQNTKIFNKFLYILVILFFIFLQHNIQKYIIGFYGFNVEFLSATLIDQILNVKFLIYKVIAITKHIFIAFIKYPLWLIIITSLFFVYFFNNKKKEHYIKFFVYALILNIIFIYAVYVHDPNPSYEFILSVTLDRVLFQTSGFYLLIILSLLNVEKQNKLKNNLHK